MQPQVDSRFSLNRFNQIVLKPLRNAFYLLFFIYLMKTKTIYSWLEQLDQFKEL